MIPFTAKILAQESRNQKGKSKIHHEVIHVPVGTTLWMKIETL